MKRRWLSIPRLIFLREGGVVHLKLTLLLIIDLIKSLYLYNNVFALYEPRDLDTYAKIYEELGRGACGDS